MNGFHNRCLILHVTLGWVGANYKLDFVWGPKGRKFLGKEDSYVRALYYSLKRYVEMNQIYFFEMKRYVEMNQSSVFPKYISFHFYRNFLQISIEANLVLFVM